MGAGRSRGITGTALLRNQRCRRQEQPPDPSELRLCPPGKRSPLSSPRPAHLRRGSSRCLGHRQAAPALHLDPVRSPELLQHGQPHQPPPLLRHPCTPRPAPPPLRARRAPWRPRCRRTNRARPRPRRDWAARRSKSGPARPTATRAARRACLRAPPLSPPGQGPRAPLPAIALDA